MFFDWRTFLSIEDESIRFHDWSPTSSASIFRSMRAFESLFERSGWED